MLSPELTDQVIGGLYEVHWTLGTGFIERIYVSALDHELRLRGLEVVQQQRYQVIYRGRTVAEIKFRHLQVDDSAFVFPVAVEDMSSISIQNLKA